MDIDAQVNTSILSRKVQFEKRVEDWESGYHQISNQRVEDQFTNSVFTYSVIVSQGKAKGITINISMQFAQVVPLWYLLNHFDLNILCSK